jgi:hypothetical protein
VRKREIICVARYNPRPGNDFSRKSRKAISGRLRKRLQEKSMLFKN